MDTMAITGGSPIGGAVDVYVIYDDGTPGHMRVDSRIEPRLSRPGAFVSKERYGERLREFREGTAAYVARLTEEDERRHHADLAALVGAGVPEETARRMAGLHGGQL